MKFDAASLLGQLVGTACMLAFHPLEVRSRLSLLVSVR